MMVVMLVCSSEKNLCCLIYPSVGCFCSRSLAVENVDAGAAVVAEVQQPLAPKVSPLVCPF
jgi:hypothetical protein